MQGVTRLLVLAVFIYGTLFAAAPLTARQQPVEGAHHHPEAQTLANPLSPSPELIAAGQKLFGDHCSECHGDEAKGDGMMGEDLDPPPPDLTDAQWKHGDTDGEIFTVIRDGTKDGMKKFGRKLTAEQIWQLVIYVRSLGPTTEKTQ